MTTLDFDCGIIPLWVNVYLYGVTMLLKMISNYSTLASACIRKVLGQTFNSQKKTKIKFAR